jgi:hypothetical protein
LKTQDTGARREFCRIPVVPWFLFLAFVLAVHFYNQSMILETGVPTNTDIQMVVTFGQQTTD